MMLTWASGAWDDYLYWQQQDKQMLRRINLLIKDIQRQPFTGIPALAARPGQRVAFRARHASPQASASSFADPQ